MSQQQIEQKIQLMQTAAVLTAVSLPAGSTEDKVSTQHERWYQFLAKVALPDETVYTSPDVPLPASPILPSDPNQLQLLARALAPILATIPGPGGLAASAAANVIATAPLPTLTTGTPK